MQQITVLTPETLPAIMWQRQPVITTELLAEIYGTAIDNIQMNFTRNASRFIEGVHYFLLQGADLKAFKANQLSVGQLVISKFTRSLYLWTERGTVRHAKILDTDNAWAVQDRLEDSYFMKNHQKPYGLRELPPATPKFLTTAMKKHINRRVDVLVRTQFGTVHGVLGRSIQDKFNVNKREFIPIEKYAEVCAFLGCEPDAKALQGDLLEPAVLPAPVVNSPFQRDEILKHVEFNQVRINALEDLLNGMKRSNELFKGVLEA